MQRRAAWAPIFVIAAAAMGSVQAGQRPTAPAGPFVQFVFTSDAHYGITRGGFRGAHDVDAHIVNAAMVAQIDTVSRTMTVREFLWNTHPANPTAPPAWGAVATVALSGSRK